MKIAFLFFCLIITVDLYSQDDFPIKESNLLWKSTETIMKDDNQESLIECTFKILENKRIEAHIGIVTHVFEIEKIEGEWENINEVGSLVYYCDNSLNKITVSRTAEGVFLLLDLSAVGGQIHKFSINSITQL